MATVEPPFAHPHLLYTFSGGLPGGEVWSTGFRTEEISTAPGDLQGFADQADAAFRIMWEATNSLQVLNPPSVTFVKTNVRQVSLSGATVFTAEKVGAPDPGQSASCNCPNQTALVVTTRTAVAGRSGRGRMYLPLLSPQLVTGTARLLPAEQTAIAQAMGSFLSKFILITSGSLGNIVGPARPAIQSRVPGRGQNDITYLQIGDVLDTQRRRRDKLIESYFTADVSQPA